MRRLVGRAPWKALLGTSQWKAERGILIETSKTPNPECLRFFSMELSFMPPQEQMDFPNTTHASKSPLAEVLFRLDGVKALYFADEFITVTKQPGSDWDDIIPIINETIIAFAHSDNVLLSPEGLQALSTSADDTEPKAYDDDVVLAIKELIKERIRPMVKQDGGNVRYVGMDDGTVFVMLEGACKTCPSSGATLKNGIERMLMHWIPEVAECVEVDEDFAYDYKIQEDQKRNGEEPPKGPLG
jgi:NFU1 iron-sulfur cluster scaffold homolog, mitochondrial